MRAINRTDEKEITATMTYDEAHRVAQALEDAGHYEMARVIRNPSVKRNKASGDDESGVWT